MQRNARDYLEIRARRIGEHLGYTAEYSCKSMRAISVVQQIDPLANGALTNAVLQDKNEVGPLPGDHWKFQAKGDDHYVILGMVAQVPAGVIQNWGYKDFLHNGNGINKLSFKEGTSLADRNDSADYFSLESLKSGLDTFPWEELPAFGPNGTIDIVAFNNGGAIVESSVQFWLMPVPAGYKAPGRGCENQCVVPETTTRG